MDWFVDNYNSFMSFAASYKLPYINLTMVEIVIIFLLTGLVVYLLWGDD